MYCMPRDQYNLAMIQNHLDEVTAFVGESISMLSSGLQRPESSVIGQKFVNISNRLLFEVCMRVVFKSKG